MSIVSQYRQFQIIKADYGIDMLFFMLTNITTETSRIIFAGEGAGELLHEAFGAKLEDGVCEVPRLVSRKKQLIPGLSAILQN